MTRAARQGGGVMTRDDRHRDGRAFPQPRRPGGRLAGVAALVATACIVVAARQATPPQDPQRTFRAVGALVTVDVSVRDGNRLVRGLTPGDFHVEDNGVAQTVEMLDVESLPIDLTLIVDTSGSLITMVDEVRQYVAEAASVLRADDRVRLITFSGEVRDVFGLQPATAPLPVEVIVADGATAIYDAVIAGLMRTRRADRRQVLVVFTDGIETNSAMDADALEAVAKRSDSVLHVLLVKDVMTSRLEMPNYYQDTRRYWLSRAVPDPLAFGRAAAATGGWMQEVAVRPDLPKALRLTLEDFRTSYVLRYRPVGVAQEGWHRIDVAVTGGHTVRARSGYFWGALNPKR
ncbi:MAG: VWA domain-containing protein [Vicinamibacterales bacterium]